MCSEGWGRTQFSLRVWPLGFCPFTNEYMHNTNWTWYIPTCFSFFVWGGHKGGGWIWEDWKEFIIYQIALCEIPK